MNRAGKQKKKSGGKGKGKKTPKTTTTEVPEDDSHVNNADAREEASGSNSESPTDTKGLFDLTVDEARKECLKLNLIDISEKPKVQVCCVKLTKFLESNGFDAETFRFAHKGNTKFPSPLLNRKNKDNDETGDSSESSDNSSVQDDDSSSDSDVPLVPKKKKSKKKSKSVRFDPNVSSREATPSANFLPPGWQILNDAVTGNPVAMLDANKRLLSISEYTQTTASTTTPGTTMPGIAASNFSNISAAASILGGAAPSMNQAQPLGSSISNGNAFKNVDFCGMSIPSFATNHANEKDCYGHNKKLVSGRFSTGKKEVLKKEVWPHHLVDCTFRPGGCDYDEMGWVELCNGFTALVLSQVDETNMPTGPLNQLRHLNRLTAYGLFAPLDPILEFNAAFMTGVENRSQDWNNLKRMKEFHDTHVQNLKLAAHRSSNNKKGDRTDKDKTDSKEGSAQKGSKGKCTKNWALSQNICFLFQNEKCEESSGHDDGNGNMLTHCCAWCYYCEKGLQLHSNSTCKDKKNPFGPFKSAGRRTAAGSGNQEQ